MKKHLIAAAVAAAVAAPAMAQNVTISGTINAGIINDGQRADSKAAIASLGGGANAINITTSEDLGGGLRAGFTSQIRFSSATGDATTNGVGQIGGLAVAAGGGAQTLNGTAANLFHAANVFISGPMGTIRLGKIAEEGSCGFDPWACTGGAAMMAGSGGPSAAATLAALRTSALVGAGTTANAIYYQTPDFNGFRVSYQSSLSAAGTVAAASDAGRENERRLLNVTYNAGPVSAQYMSITGGQNSGAVRIDDGQKETGYGFSYNMGLLTAMAYKTDKETEAGVKTADITTVGFSMPRGAYTFLGGYQKDSAATAAGAGGTALSTSATKWSLGANYSLSKRTTVGADYFQADIAGGSTGYVVRARHTF